MDKADQEHGPGTNVRGRRHRTRPTPHDQGNGNGREQRRQTVEVPPVDQRVEVPIDRVVGVGHRILGQRFNAAVPQNVGED